MKSQEDVAIVETEALPPKIVEQGPKSEPDAGPATDNEPSQEDIEASTGVEAAGDPPAVIPTEQGDVAPATEETTVAEETTEPDAAVAEGPSPAMDGASLTDDATPPATQPAHKGKSNNDMGAEMADIADEAVSETVSATEAPTQEPEEEEPIMEEMVPDETGQPVLDSTDLEVPPPAPEPPGQPDDTASVEEAGEKKVQFAPGTPEPRPTQRKKKNGKSSKSKKSRKPLPQSLDDQGSPDDIVAIVEGPFDEPLPPPSESVELAAPAVIKEEVNDAAEGSVDVASAEAQAVEHIPEPILETQIAAPAPTEPVTAEPARSEKSSKRKGKEKSKKKSSKSKVKVVEASPVVAGLGIDFSGTSSDVPSFVDTVDEEAPLGAGEANNAQDIAAEDAGEKLVTFPEANPTEMAVGPAELENAAATDLQPAADAGEDATAPQESTPSEPVEPASKVSEVQTDLSHQGDQAHAIDEAATLCEAGPEVAAEEPGIDDELGSKPDDFVESVDESAIVSGPDSDAAAEDPVVSESTGDLEEATVIDQDVASDVGSLGDASSFPDDQDSSDTPDSGVDLGEDSPVIEEEIASQAEPEAGDGIIAEAGEKAEEHEASNALKEGMEEEAAETVEQHGETALLTEESAVDEEAPMDSPALDVIADATEQGEEASDLDDLSDTESTELEGAEPACPQVDGNAKEGPVEAVVHNRPPSIEQLSNATEVGDYTEGEGDEDDAPPTQEGVIADVFGEDEATADAVDTNDVASDENIHADTESPNPGQEPLSAEKAVDPIRIVEEDSSQPEADTSAEPPEIADDITAHPSKATEDASAESLGTELPTIEVIKEEDEDAPEVLADSIEPDAVETQDMDAVQDELQDTHPSNDGDSSETVATETPAAILDAAPADASAERHEIVPPASEPGAESATVQEPAAEQKIDETAAASEQNPIEEESTEIQKASVGADAVTQGPLVEEPSVAEVAEPSSEPAQESEAVDHASGVAEIVQETIAIAPEAIEVVQEAVPEPDQFADTGAGEAPPPPPEHMEEHPAPITEDPVKPEEPIVIPAPNHSEPPSPKLSRSSGSKSKGEHYQTRPSKKISKDPEKSRHQRSSNYRRERTPEEAAERQRRKDARRLAESARLLEEERRRFEEEEMRRIRHEARRAARKAAAEEVARLAREEGEAIARREAERRRRRRESDVRPRERRESDVRPRERRESKSSGGFFGMGSGKSETKAGLFVRTDSGGSSRAMDSRAGDGERLRRTSPLKERLVEDSQADIPKNTSHDGSSKRRRHHRTESDRAEPRRRDTGERRDEGRRDGERKRSSKPEKPKGFFGSLFAKF